MRSGRGLEESARLQQERIKPYTEVGAGDLNRKCGIEWRVRSERSRSRSYATSHCARAYKGPYGVVVNRREDVPKAPYSVVTDSEAY